MTTSASGTGPNAVPVEISQAPAVQSLLQRVEQGGALSLDGVHEGARPFLVALLHHLLPTRMIVAVTDCLKSQETFQQDLATWLHALAPSVAAPTAQGPQPLFFPAWEVLPQESRLPHADVISERLETLLTLQACAASNHRPLPVVTDVTALLQATFATPVLRDKTVCLKRGDRRDPLDLVEWLEEQAYEPEAQVTRKGEIALRGGILDVFPLSSPWPVRLEFFGDELESLRSFDPLTQVSRETIESITLPPAGELGLLRRLTGDAARHLGSLLDYLPPRTILLLSDPDKLATRAGDYTRQAGPSPLARSWDDILARAHQSQFTRLLVADTGDLVPATTNYPPESEPTDRKDDPACAAGSLDPCVSSGAWDSRELVPPIGLEAQEPDTGTLHSTPIETTRLPMRSLDAFRPLLDHAPDPEVAAIQRREFFAQIHRWIRQDLTVRIFCNNDGERQRFLEIWRDYGLGTSENNDPGAATPGLEPHVELGALSRGFLFEEARLAVVTDAEVFGRYRVARPRRLKSAHAQAARSALDIDFTELEEGDYVVHLQHGVGRYLGLKMLPTLAGRHGVTRPESEAAASEECLAIEYAPSDPDQPPPKLYVPVTQAHLVSKYVGAGKARPPLNTLGSPRWARAKDEAERAVRDLAGELLAIQATRASQPGHAFGTDTPWQREFESAFLYEETPDQARAIDATKRDMEQARPMDRLICGDVGFGKTEVAIRAAFKAVMAGKQVAVLVPTTVLAQQHFNTFRERMADYPIRIDLLSRFRTHRQQQKTLHDLAHGAVDMVIGTHRLVQRDVVFKDLGLVVIDEEQRFGVLHKERFKLLRQMVDVLTLSATPIPRTLYLALTGARDMSTIETPPQDRLPVETIVTPYDERLIRDAIQRELGRGGQVFFLHNRVTSIDTMARRLKNLVPQARLVVGHGQMDADDLEEVMTQFVNGEADVLLSTTIIESGLDIPNANTILIDRADRFGLSDLYQLRGRVGRYKHQAYAYFLLPRHAGLLSDARKRIGAIKQYSSLGSGFKIAMRDLEIRGAGNLLGSEQSGHITAVGFELYCQLLKKSVATLKGEKVKPRIEVTVRLDFLSAADVATIADGQSTQAKAAQPQLQTPRSAPRLPHSPPDSRLPAPDPEPTTSSPSAHLPARYIPETRHRIEIYRRLAQADTRSDLDALEREARDRFGPAPEPVALLFEVTALRLLAAERGITAVETRDDRVMLTRNNDFITLGGKFPRLSREDPKARLKEIRKLLLAL